MKMLGRTGLSRRETWKTRERHNRKGKGVASRSFSRKSSLFLSLSLLFHYGGMESSETRLPSGQKIFFGNIIDTSTLRPQFVSFFILFYTSQNSRRQNN